MTPRKAHNNFIVPTVRLVCAFLVAMTLLCGCNPGWCLCMHPLSLPMAENHINTDSTGLQLQAEYCYEQERVPQA